MHHNRRSGPAEWEEQKFQLRFTEKVINIHEAERKTCLVSCTIRYELQLGLYSIQNYGNVFVSRRV
jgi:hypothetical protein